MSVSGGRFQVIQELDNVLVYDECVGGGGVGCANHSTPCPLTTLSEPSSSLYSTWANRSVRE